MRMLRWFMVVPGAVLAWYAVFGVGLFTYPMIESTLCPPGDMISGLCHNERVSGVLDVVIHVFVGFSALVVVLSAVAIAPARKRIVAWLAFVAGSAVTVALALSAGAASYALVAVVAGLVAALMVRRSWGPEVESGGGA